MRAILFGLSLAFVALPALAQTKGDLEAQCMAQDSDVAMAGCTALIQAGLEGGENLVVTYNNRGIAYSRKGLYDQAIADYTQAIALKPDYVNAYSNRGYAYATRGLYDQAIADETQAIALRPDLASPYVTRGVAYEHKGLRYQAIADFRAALNIDSSVPNASDGLRRLSVATASDRVEASYYVAFCRPPQPAEMNFWRGDPRSASVDVLIAAHRAWLRKTPAIRQETIVHSYHSIFNRDPQPAELAYWDDRVAKSGETCSELLVAHQRWKGQHPSS